MNTTKSKAKHKKPVQHTLEQYSLDELREMKALTDDIRQNFEAIHVDDGNLPELERQTESIVANLKAVSEGFGVEDDLNELERQTDCVVANLRAIDEDVYTLEDLQELEKQTEFIVNRLKVISENESSHLDELEAETSNSGRNVRANTSA